MAECESAGASTGAGEYLPPWLAGAVPFRGSAPEPCSRFVARASNHSASAAGSDGGCPADLFDTTRTEGCSHWVFEPDQRTTLVDEVGASLRGKTHLRETSVRKDRSLDPRRQKRRSMHFNPFRIRSLSECSRDTSYLT